MPRITFILPDSTHREVDAPLGRSLMEVARDLGLPGIVAECNGSLACATCHCYLTNADFYPLDAPTGDEDDMLDFTAAARRDCSRLSCQVKVTTALEGLEVTLPPRQV